VGRELGADRSGGVLMASIFADTWAPPDRACRCLLERRLRWSGGLGTLSLALARAITVRFCIGWFSARESLVTRHPRFENAKS